MTTQKRRVIYLSDEEWKDIRLRAGACGLTMSAYIRSSLIGGHVIPLSIQRELAEQDAAILHERVLTDGRLIDRTGSFNSRPFTPVPKTTGK